MGDCENILGDWDWLGVIARFSKGRLPVVKANSDSGR